MRDDGRARSLPPPVGDLLAVLEWLPPELREWTVGAYILASERHSWAWEALVRLLAETKGRAQPDILNRWAVDVVSGRKVAPPRPRGNPPQPDRDLFLCIAYQALGANRKAIEDLADLFGRDESRIGKIVRSRSSVGGALALDLLRGA